MASGHSLRLGFAVGLVLAFFGAAGLAGTARADELRVTNNTNDEPGSLRAVLASARSGDVIVFDAGLAGTLINLVTPDTRTLGEPPAIPLGPTALVVDGIAITIDGTDAPGLQIDGASTWRVFLVLNGGSLTLRNVTVQNGHALGGAGSRGGGGGAGLGGGVFVADGSTLTLDGVMMLQHRATGGAGGPARSEAGTCSNGGGGMSGPAPDLPSPGLSGAGGQPNPGARSGDAGRSGGDGGGGSGGCGVLAFDSDTGTMRWVLHPGGAGGWGGGGGASGRGAIGDRTCVLRSESGGLGGFGGGGGGRGTAVGSGALGCPIVIPPPPAGTVWGGGQGSTGGCFFDGCTTGAGGGGAGAGAAVFVRGGTLNVARSTFASNRSVGGPGTVEEPVRNTGMGVGAVFVLEGTASITSSTFWGNVGGAVHVLALGPSAESFLYVQNTVLAGSMGADCRIEGRGRFISQGNNLLENAGTCAAIGSDVVGVDPMLGALGGHGGPTATMLPDAASPLLGAGACAIGEVDQRGVPRASAPLCDIGAVELDRATLLDAAVDLDGGVPDASASMDAALGMDAGVSEEDSGGGSDAMSALDTSSAFDGASSTEAGATLDVLGGEDARFLVDVGAIRDGDVTRDVGLDGGGAVAGPAGCGCTATRPRPVPWALLLFAALLGTRRARRAGERRV